MAHGSPDWVRAIQVSVNIGEVFIVPTTAEQKAAGGINRIVTSSTSYVTVLEWEVSAGKLGELSEVSITSSLLAKTKWKVVVGSFTLIEDTLLDAPLTIPYYDLKLAAGTKVTVSVKSTDGSEITADASIVGKELG